MPPPARIPQHPVHPAKIEESPASGLLKRPRKPSFKKVLRQSAEIAGERWQSVVIGMRNTSGSDSGLPRPQFLGQGGRKGSKTSTLGSVSDEQYDGRTAMREEAERTPTSSGSKGARRDRSSFVGAGVEEVNGEIEKRVLEMAGLGLGSSVSSPEGGRRVKSEAVRVGIKGGTLMERSKSADAEKAAQQMDGVQGREEEVVDMKMLRRIADLPENQRCADCGKGMKASRWATLSTAHSEWT